MSKKGKKKRGSKAQRTAWWYSLTPERQAECIDYWIKDKAKKRRARSIRIMKNRKPFDCKQCTHGIGSHCTDHLPRGCEYFYSLDGKIQGIAYNSQKIGKSA